MKSYIIIMLIALAAGSLCAQPPEDGAFDSKSLQLEFVRVEDPRSIHGTLQDLYGRSIELREDGRQRFVNNIMLLGNNILVHDTPENVKRIVAGIKRLVEETKEDEFVAPQMVRKEIVPEYLALHDVITALGPLARPRMLKEKQSGYENITVVESSGLLIIHDSVANVEQMQRLIALVDRPQQQVMIRCRIIQGDDDLDAPDASLAKLLPPELKDLTRFSNFKILAAGAIRTAATNGRPILMEMAGSNELNATLRINPGGYSPESQTLRLTSVDLNYEGPMPAIEQQNTTRVSHAGGFRRERQNLQTSTTLPADEVVVIGALGENPIFVVLEMTPIKN